MAEANEATFGDLYDYATKNGVVIPITSEVKAKVEELFRTVFGSGFSVDATTTQGRLIEALALLFVDMLGVTAQNANSFNPEQAAGAYLDNLGALFGIMRLADESDYRYRLRLLESQSRGRGYAMSIRRAISEIPAPTGTKGIVSVCVLDNGLHDPAMLPEDTKSVWVNGHSVWICVGYDPAIIESGIISDLDGRVVEAINATISAGCGMTPGQATGTEVTMTWSDAETGTSKTITFYRSVQKTVTFAVPTADVAGTASFKQTSSSSSHPIIHSHSDFTIAGKSGKFILRDS